MGPPAAGKSTYVANHGSPGDIVIDLDGIAREFGLGRSRPEHVAELLAERNRRLVALANEPPERVAWVIVSAPGKSLRQWWSDALAVTPENLVLLCPPRDELRRRIVNDPDRLKVRALHCQLVDRWLEREMHDDPGPIKRGCDANGNPLDPLHPWNRERRQHG